MAKLIDELLDKIAEKAAEKIADYIIKRDYQQNPQPSQPPQNPNWGETIPVMYGVGFSRFQPYVSTVTQDNSVDEQYTIERRE